MDGIIIFFQDPDAGDIERKPWDEPDFLNYPLEKSEDDETT